MGTSQSSDGPPSGVPMVPPWVDNPPGVDGAPDEAGPDDNDQDDTGQDIAPLIAPVARFGSARNALGRFAEGGDGERLRQGVGRYVSTGLGGSAAATSRLAGTARSASSIYSLLGGTGQGPDAPDRLNYEAFRDRSASVIIKEVLDAVRPIDGSDDAEVTRSSTNDALTELVDRYPNVDLLDLTEEQRTFVLERFVSMDVYRRFALDVGKHIQDKAPSAAAGLSRLRQAREYIRETVIASFQRIRSTGRPLSESNVSRLVQTVLMDAFNVFSEYAE